MNDIRNQKIVGLAAAAIVLPIVIGLLFGAAAVYYLTVVVGLLVGLLVYSVITAPKPRKKVDPWEDREPRPREPQPKPRPSPRTTELTSTLPSTASHFRFHLTGTVSWVPVKDTTEHKDPERLARDAILARAEKVTARFPISERERAQEALGAALGVSEPDRTNEIEASLAEVTLSVEKDDERKVRLIETTLKDWDVFVCERDREIEIRKYLHQDALASPGSTLVWWLSRNLRRFDESIDRIGTFTRVSTVAQGGTDPTPDAPRAGAASGMRIAGADGTGVRVVEANGLRTHVEALLPDVDDDERGVIAGQVAQVVGDHGHASAAARIRSAYGLQDLADPDPDSADGGVTTVPDDSGTGSRDRQDGKEGKPDGEDGH